LVDTRVDPSDVCNAAIRIASRMENEHKRQDYIKIIELLIDDPRVDPSDEDNTALHCALIDGYEDVVQILITDPRVDKSLLDKYY
jgi:hypothetical protein